jgi:hypothetical protein
MQKRMPNPKAVAYEVRAKVQPGFRRCGMWFTPDKTETVDAAALSEKQKIDLLNTPMLIVEELLAKPARPRDREEGR